MNLFYCYSHKDEALRDSLATHLSVLRRRGLITEWYDRCIMPGSDWKSSIDTSLESADIVLLLISADFLASDYCFDVEMQRALQRHKAGKAAVVPVILRAVDWSEAPFGDLQALPKDRRPVTSWPDRDEAFVDVTSGLRKLIVELAHRREMSSVPTGEEESGDPLGPKDEAFGAIRYGAASTVLG